MSSSAVSVPGKRRLQMFCQTGLPLLVFAAIGLMVAWFWHESITGSGTVGEIFARRADVTALVAGRLVPLTSQDGGFVLEEFAPVKKGQVLARLDPKPTLARISVLKAEADALNAQLDEKIVEMKFEVDKTKGQHAANRAQVAQELAKLSIELVKTEAMILEATATEKYKRDIVNWMGPISQKRPGDAKRIDPKTGKEVEWQIPYIEFAPVEGEMQVALANKGSHARTRKEITAKMTDMQKLLETLPTDAPTIDLEKVLNPIRKEAEAKLAEVKEFEDQLEWMEIRAPFDGVVTAVHAQPGQAVGTSLPVCTIAATESSYVLAYIRQNQAVRPRVGMKAEIRFRGSSELVPGAIVKVGAQVEAISPKQLFDHKVQEWGLPVAIQLNWPQGKKDSLQPRPGEVVYVQVHANEFDERIVQSADAISSLSGGAIVFANK